MKLPFRVFAVVAAVMLGCPQSALAQENPDGTALEAQLAKNGLGGRSFIGISKSELSEELLSPGGATLTLSTMHQWKEPVTLREMDVGGVAAYSIDAMAVQQDQSGNVTKAQMPLGPGTIYQVFGTVQLLGNTIHAEDGAPLVFVVHNANNAAEAKSSWVTGGPLAPIKFKFLENTAGQSRPIAKDVFLQLVHISGKGWAALKDGKKVTFPAEASQAPRQTGTQSAESVGAKRVIAKKLLAAIDSDVLVKDSLIISDDCRHVAYVAKSGDGQCVVVDGKTQSTYDAIVEKSLCFSPDGKRTAYLARKGGKQFAVIDGKEGKGYAEGKSANPYALGEVLIFSPDSKETAYIASTGKDSFMVVGTKEGQHYLLGSVSSPVFSPDGKQMAFIAYTAGGQWGPSLIVQRGKEKENAVFSLNDFAFRLEDAPCISPPVFSPNGKRISCAFANMMNFGHVYIDGKETSMFSANFYGWITLTFSPDSKNFAYVTRDTGEKGDGLCHVVLNGVKLKGYEEIIESTVTFSPDGKRTAYAAEDADKKAFWIVDNAAQTGYDSVGYLRFSPDGKRFAYSATRDKVSTIVIDGKEGDWYEGAAAPIFSPDGKRVAYCAGRDGKAFLFEDGKQSDAWDGIDGGIFSPDGKALVYGAKIGDKMTVVIDGTAGEAFDALLSGFSFDSAKNLHYVTRDGNSMYVVEERIE